jgi:hypothetical protein
VSSVTVTNPGNGYITGAFPMTISGGGGSGAIISGSLGSATGSGITSITVVDGGIGYTSASVASVSGGGGFSAALGVPTLTQRVSSISVTNGGAGYSGVPTIAFSGGGGAGAAATAQLNGGDIHIGSNPVVIVSR